MSAITVIFNNCFDPFLWDHFHLLLINVDWHWALMCDVFRWVWLHDQNTLLHGLSDLVSWTYSKILVFNFYWDVVTENSFMSKSDIRACEIHYGLNEWNIIPCVINPQCTICISKIGKIPLYIFPFIVYAVVYMFPFKVLFKKRPI